MAKEIRLDSPLTVDQVFAVMEARNKDWRESDIPEALKRYGLALGFRMKRKGQSFTLWVDRAGRRNNVETILCQGTITPTATGCQIHAEMMRPSSIWVFVLMVWLLAGWQIWKGTPSWSAVGMALFASALAVAFRIVIYLVNENQAEAEFRVFETILRRAAAGDPAPLTAPRAIP